MDSVILIAVSPLRDFLWTSTTGGLSTIRFIVLLYAADYISIDDTTSPQKAAQASMRRRFRLLTDPICMYASGVFCSFESALQFTRV